MKSTNLITAAFCIVLTVFAYQASAQVKKKAVVHKTTTAAAVAKPAPKPPFATPAEIEDGQNLVAKSDCLACHKVADKLVGPAYIAIAQKYPQDQNTLNTLTQKVISGGSGVWGAVPMAPHAAIAPADANKMIKYILTLNTNNPPVAAK